MISNTQNFLFFFGGGGLMEQGTSTIQLGAEEGRQPGREGMSQLRKKVPVMTDRESLRRERV
jgi:hypothetical protein